MEGESLDEVQWRAPEWIQMFGLRTDNVLDYFAQSPFYDRTSNNQVLKMQSQFNEQLHGRPDLTRELRNMKGIEFVVVLHKEPEMWVIRKQNRLSPLEARVLSTYFVVGENIYMAPTIYSIISSRLLTIAHSLNEALSKAVTLPNYSPSRGYSYITDVQLTATEESNTSTPASSASSIGRKSSGPQSSHDTPQTKVKTPANYVSPPTARTPGVNVSGEQEIQNSRSIEMALAFTMSNSTVYLDADGRDVAPTGGGISKPRKRKQPERGRILQS